MEPGEPGHRAAPGELSRRRPGAPAWCREGEVVRLRFEGPFTANRFLPGHRLRIVLSGAFFPLFSVNPQTGEQEFESAATRAGDIRIHHSVEHASWIVLPEVPPGDR